MSEKRLKKGFTTGAAAAAAAKAALISLFDSPPSSVVISFLNGQSKSIEVFSIETISPESADALIIKDAGDDPDVTHKAKIGAKVTIEKSDRFSIKITGGIGVGKVTKPGLELPVGEPAINPGPRKMIHNEINDVITSLNLSPHEIKVEVYVPDGEVLAEKTLNARLGIIGGISILGTTGIVTPMSHDAYIATIRSGIEVAAASGSETLVFTTGRRSERYAMERLSWLSEESFIQTGDFFKAALDMAVLNSKIQTIIYTIFFGKAVKMAMGFEHTHAAKSELTLTTLSEWADHLTEDKNLVNQIKNSNTAREAFFHIHPGNDTLLSFVAQKIIESAAKFSDNKLKIKVLIFDFEGNPVCSLPSSLLER